MTTPPGEIPDDVWPRDFSLIDDDRAVVIDEVIKALTAEYTHGNLVTIGETLIWLSRWADRLRQ